MTVYKKKYLSATIEICPYCNRPSGFKASSTGSMSELITNLYQVMLIHINQRCDQKHIKQKEVKKVNVSVYIKTEDNINVTTSWETHKLILP